jgi:hypothetical protein
VFALRKNAGYAPFLAFASAVQTETFTFETLRVVSTATRLLVVQSLTLHSLAKYQNIKPPKSKISIMINTNIDMVDPSIILEKYFFILSSLEYLTKIQQSQNRRRLEPSDEQVHLQQ